MAHGEVNYFELPFDDEDRARSFYSGLFGWDMQSRTEQSPYLMFRSGPGDVGGGMGSRGVTGPSVLRLYVMVESLDESLAKVVELGGSVIVEKTEFGGGSYAAIADSEGSEIGIWEPAAG